MRHEQRKRKTGNQRGAGPFEMTLEKEPLTWSKRNSTERAACAADAHRRCRAWTRDGKLPHPSYKGILEHQDNAEIYRVDEFIS